MAHAVRAPDPSAAAPWRPPDPSRLGTPRFVAMVLLGLAAVALGARMYAIADLRLVTGPERILQALAFAAIAAAPAALAAMSTRRRAVLLVPAALVLMPMAVLSLAGVLLPLLVPAVLLWLAFATRWDGAPCGWWRAILASVVVVGLLLLAVAALVVHHDPRSYGDAGCTFSSSGSMSSGSCAAGIGTGGAGSTGDVVTAVEALVSLGLVGSALLAGWLLAAPRRRSRTRPVDVGSPVTT